MQQPGAGRSLLQAGAALEFRGIVVPEVHSASLFRNSMHDFIDCTRGADFRALILHHGRVDGELHHIA